MKQYEKPNYTRVFFAANQGQVIPAETGARRFLVLDVGGEHKEDGPYFAAIDKQMAAGGAEAMMFDLVHFDISAVDFTNVPVTDALKDQIAMGLDPEMEWLVSFLSEGEMPKAYGDSLRRTLALRACVGARQ